MPTAVTEYLETARRLEQRRTQPPPPLRLHLATVRGSPHPRLTPVRDQNVTSTHSLPRHWNWRSKGTA